MNTFRSILSRRACLFALASSLVCAGAHSQTNVVKILVPAPAGGASDAIARTLGDSIRKSTGQTVIIENKPGGGGVIALDALLSAPRDGSTFILSPNSLVTENPYSYKFRIDVLKDLAPLAEVANVSLVLVTNPQLPVRNVGELITYVKANPGKISYASYSAGTLSHIMGIRLNKTAGLDMEHAPYKGSPPALQDLMGGQVQFMFDGMGTSLPMIKAGKLRALAVTSAKRESSLPDVPTLAELGYGDMTQTMGTSVWSVPDVPADVRKKFRDELLKAIATPEVKNHLLTFGMEAGNPAQTVEELQSKLKRENERTAQVLQSVNYKP